MPHLRPCTRGQLLDARTVCEWRLRCSRQSQCSVRSLPSTTPAKAPQRDRLALSTSRSEPRCLSRLYPTNETLAKNARPSKASGFEPVWQPRCVHNPPRLGQPVSLFGPPSAPRLQRGPVVGLWLAWRATQLKARHPDRANENKYSKHRELLERVWSEMRRLQ